MWVATAAAELNSHPATAETADTAETAQAATTTAASHGTAEVSGEEAMAATPRTIPAARGTAKRT